MTGTLVIDIGGTYTRFAIMDHHQRIHFKNAYVNYEHDSFLQVFEHYARDYNQPLNNIDHCCIAVAGPVNQGHAKLTNLSWQLDQGELQKRLPFNHVLLINDFHALGYSLPLLTHHCLIALQSGKPQIHGMKAIIGAGTGLGVALVKHDKHFCEVFPSEGGHADFAPTNQRQIALLEFLLQKYQHVSSEHILSGHGIENVYEFICMENNTTFCVNHHTASDISGQKIIKLAVQTQQDLAIKAIQLFSEIYAAFVGNVALQTLSYGGVYLAGGIARHILPFLQNEKFIRNFCAKGRLASVLKDIPIHYIQNNNANLLGAGNYLTHQAKIRQTAATVDG